MCLIHTYSEYISEAEQPTVRPIVAVHFDGKTISLPRDHETNPHLYIANHRMELERNTRFIEQPEIATNSRDTQRTAVKASQTRNVGSEQTIEQSNRQTGSIDQTARKNNPSFGIQMRSMMQNSGPSNQRAGEQQIDLQQAIDEITKLDQQQHQMIDYNEESELEPDNNNAEVNETSKNFTDSSSSNMMMETPVSVNQKPKGSRKQETLATSEPIKSTTAKSPEKTTTKQATLILTTTTTRRPAQTSAKTVSLPITTTASTSTSVSTSTTPASTTTTSTTQAPTTSQMNGVESSSRASNWTARDMISMMILKTVSELEGSNEMEDKRNKATSSDNNQPEPTTTMSPFNSPERLNLENGRPTSVLKSQQQLTGTTTSSRLPTKTKPTSSPMNAQTPTQSISVSQSSSTTTGATSSTTTTTESVVATMMSDKQDASSNDLQKSADLMNNRSSQVTGSPSVDMSTIKPTSESESTNSEAASNDDNTDDAVDMVDSSGSGNQTETAGDDSESDSESDNEESGDDSTETTIETTTMPSMKNDMRLSSSTTAEELVKTVSTTPPTLLTTIDIERLPMRSMTVDANSRSTSTTQMVNADREKEMEVTNVPGQSSQSAETSVQRAPTSGGPQTAITMPMDALMRMVMLNQFDNQKNSVSSDKPASTNSQTSKSQPASSTEASDKTTGPMQSTSQTPFQTTTPSISTSSSPSGASRTSEPQTTTTMRRKLQPPPTTQMPPVDMKPSRTSEDVRQQTSPFAMMTTQTLDSMAQKAVTMVLDSLQGSTSSEPIELMVNSGKDEPKIELLNMDMMPIQRVPSLQTAQQSSDNLSEQIKANLMEQAQQQMAMSEKQQSIIDVEPGMRLRPLMQSIPMQATKSSQQSSQAQSVSPSVLSNDQVYMIMMPSPPQSQTDRQTSTSTAVKPSNMPKRPPAPAMMSSPDAGKRQGTKSAPNRANGSGQATATMNNQGGQLASQQGTKSRQQQSATTPKQAAKQTSQQMGSSSSQSSQSPSRTTMMSTASMMQQSVSSTSQPTSSTSAPTTSQDQMRMTQRELAAMRSGKLVTLMPSGKLTSQFGSSMAATTQTAASSSSSTPTTSDTSGAFGDQSITTTPSSLAQTTKGTQFTAANQTDRIRQTETTTTTPGMIQTTTISSPKETSRDRQRAESKDNQSISKTGANSNSNNNNKTSANLTAATKTVDINQAMAETPKDVADTQQSQSAGQTTSPRPNNKPANGIEQQQNPRTNQSQSSKQQSSTVKPTSQQTSKTKTVGKTNSRANNNATSASSPSNQLDRLRAREQIFAPSQAKGGSEQAAAASAIRQFGGANRMSALANKPVAFGRPVTMVMTMSSGSNLQPETHSALRQHYELPTFEYGPSISVRRPDEPLANGQVPNCTLTGKNFCVLTKDYPMDAVRRAVEQSFRSVRIMYEELQTVSDQELHKDDYINATNNQAASGKFACQTQVEMMRPGWAKDEITKEWMLVVNTDVFPQRVRTESCAQANTPCEFIAPFYDSTCQQRYSLHRMIAIDPHDPSRSPQVAVFKFPAGCVCRVHPIRKTNLFQTPQTPTTTPVAQTTTIPTISVSSTRAN